MKRLTCHLVGVAMALVGQATGAPGGEPPGASLQDRASQQGFNGAADIHKTGTGATPGGGPAVAIVNGEPITASELVATLVRQNGREVLEKLIQRRVIEQAMRREGVVITAEDIARAVRKDRAAVEIQGEGVPGGPTLEAEVKRRFNMDLEEYKQNIIRTRLFVRRMVMRDTRVDEEDLRIWYARHVRAYTRPEHVQVAHILIQHTDPKTGRKRGRKWILDRLARIREQILSGRRSFVKAVRRYSEDEQTRRRKGALGWIPRHVQGNFSELAWKLAPGETSTPVRTALGYHLIQVIARRAKQVPRFEQIVERIREDYYGEKVRTEADLRIRDLVADTRITRRLAEGIREMQAGRAASDRPQPPTVAPAGPNGPSPRRDEFVPYDGE